MLIRNFKMSVKRENSSDAVLTDLMKEYEKFMSLSKKKFSKNGDQIQEEEGNYNQPGGDIIGSNQDSPSPTSDASPSEESPKKSKSKMFSKFTNFKQTFTQTFSQYNTSEKIQVKVQTFTQQMSESDSYKNFQDLMNKKVVLWKTPEPLKRPEDLELQLIGVALFKGNEVISKAIRKLTKSRYSHVALLMHDVKKDRNDQDGWYVYSANGSAAQILDDHRFPQVQLEKWSDNIKGTVGAANI